MVWLVLEEVGLKAESGPSEVVRLSWFEGKLVVKGVGLGEARICGVEEESSVVREASLLETCWTSKRSPHPGYV